MSQLLDNIHEYMFTVHPNTEKQKVIEAYDSATVYIAMEIAEYAHRNQKQLNGTPYINHCYDCLDIYRRFVGITGDDPFCIDLDLMHEIEIPFEGVQEVCLLHDVLEDTDLTIKDVESIFVELGYCSYFTCWIKYPLQLITHDKSTNYMEYMGEVLKNDTSAMAKMADLISNLDLSRLPKFEDEEMERANKYIQCFAMINVAHKFLEKIIIYRKRFAED